jgi:cell division topological specificity factor MinE
MRQHSSPGFYDEQRHHPDNLRSFGYKKKPTDKSHGWLVDFFLALKALWEGAFRKPKSVRRVATERLQACLTSDRLSLSEQKMAEVKNHLVQVLSKYVHISDPEGVTMALVPVRACHCCAHGAGGGTRL